MGNKGKQSAVPVSADPQTERCERKSIAQSVTELHQFVHRKYCSNPAYGQPYLLHTNHTHFPSHCSPILPATYMHTQSFSELNTCSVDPHNLLDSLQPLHHLKHNRPYSPFSTFTISTNGRDHSLSPPHCVCIVCLWSSSVNWSASPTSTTPLLYCERQTVNSSDNQLVHPCNALYS